MKNAAYLRKWFFGKPIVLFVFLFLTITTGNRAQVQAQVPVKDKFVYMPVVAQLELPKWYGPDGGSIISLAADPRNLNVVYAGTNGAGVFKSTNGGQTWSRSNSGLSDLSIYSLAVDPVNSQIVFAGGYGGGVFRSLDGGQSWAAVNNGIHSNSVVYSLAVNPGDHNQVYAATRIRGTDPNNLSLHGVMYKSENGGASWNSVLEDNDDFYYSIAVNPSRPNVVIVTKHEGGPLYSEHYGGSSSWASASGYGLEGEGLKGRAVAFDPRDSTYRAFYATWHGGSFVSLNNGITWGGPKSGTGTFHTYPNGLSVKPGGPNVVYMASHEYPSAILKSANSGESWMLTGLSGSKMYSVAALSGDVVVAGAYADGLFRSTDGGSSWSRSMSGITNSAVTGWVVSNSSTIYASTQTGGVFKSTNGGDSWVEFANGLNDKSINGLLQHPANPNIMYALTSNAGLRRIDLGSGSTWTASIEPPLSGTNLSPANGVHDSYVIPEADAEILSLEANPPAQDAVLDLETTNAGVAAPVLSMAFAPSNANIAYTGTNGSGVYLSTDSGLNWTPVGLGGYAVRSLAVSPADPNRVYAATNAASILKASNDGGRNWFDIGMPEYVELYSVSVSRFDASRVYVGTSSGVYRYDGGWTKIGLPNVPVYVVAASPFLPGRLYAGATSGAYFSTGDTSLRPLNQELTNTTILSINFDPKDNLHIFFGTATRGTLRAPLP